MALESSYSYGANTTSRDHILPLSSPLSFAPFVAMTHRAARHESTVLRALLPCNTPFVYINSSIVLSVESIIFSHTKLLQLQTDSPGAPIAVPTYTFIHIFSVGKTVGF